MQLLGPWLRYAYHYTVPGVSDAYTIPGGGWYFWVTKALSLVRCAEIGAGWLVWMRFDAMVYAGLRLRSRGQDGDQRGHDGA
jgi:hypothetical protein